MNDIEMQKLLTRLGDDTLIIALYDCSPEIYVKILKNKSKRSRELLLEDLEINKQYPPDQRYIVEAREEILIKIKELNEAGLISFPTNKG